MATKTKKQISNSYSCNTCFLRAWEHFCFISVCVRCCNLFSLCPLDGRFCCSYLLKTVLCVQQRFYLFYFVAERYHYLPYPPPLPILYPGKIRLKKLLKCGVGEWECVVGMGLKFHLETHASKIHHLSAHGFWSLLKDSQRTPRILWPLQHS